MIAVILRSKKLEISTDDSIYIFVFGLIGALVGAKILYLLLSVEQIVTDISAGYNLNVLFAKYISGGLVFYGGMIGSFVMAYVMAKAYKADIWEQCKVLIPSIPLVHGVARIGCFFAGCCHGLKADTFISITYTTSQYAPNNTPLIPVQLIEAVFNLIIFGILSRYNRSTPGKQYLFTYVVLYVSGRFMFEFLRGDVIRGSWLMLSTSQWISLIIITIILLLLKQKP
jgi:phosphatidylglycerol:prolipoprotein diacylglycerol transferase